ncbi:MAG: hypothetical protein R6V45_07950 [Oceanipulchritudo sp.]
MNPEIRYAVLTGDIVKSSRLAADELERVRESLGEAADCIRAWQRGLVKGKLAFFRGDSWQLLLTDPGRALRATVFLRARLIATGLADSRVALGIGDVPNVSAHNITKSTGEAFSLSGEALDTMKVSSRLAIAVTDVPERSAALLGIIGLLSDAIIRDWTQRQAEIVSHAAQPSEPIHAAIANALTPPVSRQAVTRSLNGAHWEAIREAVRQFEAFSWK